MVLNLKNILAAAGTAAIFRGPTVSIYTKVTYTFKILLTAH